MSNNRNSFNLLQLECFSGFLNDNITLYNIDIQFNQNIISFLGISL